jgi:hypothetical protein
LKVKVLLGVPLVGIVVIINVGAPGEVAPKVPIDLPLLLDLTAMRNVLNRAL